MIRVVGFFMNRNSFTLIELPNVAIYYKQQRLVHWCNHFNQGNYRNIHSDEYRSKTEKKHEYY